MIIRKSKHDAMASGWEQGEYKRFHRAVVQYDDKFYLVTFDNDSERYIVKLLAMDKVMHTIKNVNELVCA